MDFEEWYKKFYDKFITLDRKELAKRAFYAGKSEQSIPTIITPSPKTL